MPTLIAEFPPGLLDGGLPAGERAWVVGQVKPRQEKALAEVLRVAGVPYYLPLVVKRERRATVVPLFPGYAFLWADRDERVRALTTGRLVRTLPVPQQPKLWHDLRQVRTLLASGLPVLPEDKLAAGTRVVIREGSMAGLRGRIIREATGGRFVVQVDFIQRGAAVWLDELSLAAVADELD